MFIGLALLSGILGVAFGGKALGLWPEVSIFVGAGALVVLYVLDGLTWKLVPPHEDKD